MIRSLAHCAFILNQDDERTLLEVLMLLYDAMFENQEMPDVTLRSCLTAFSLVISSVSLNDEYEHLEE